MVKLYKKKHYGCLWVKSIEEENALMVPVSEGSGSRESSEGTRGKCSGSKSSEGARG